MDLEMPEMGGLDATVAIRGREAEQGGRLPIFALTARATAEDRERCLAAGMDGYLVKPVHQTELLALAEGLVAGRRAALGEPARPRPTPALEQEAAGAPATVDAKGMGAEEGGATEATLPEGGPVDWQAVLGGVGGDIGLLERVIDATLEEGPALLAELRGRARTGDAAGLHRAAHKLEGTLRTVHDDELIARAEEIEMRARRADLDRLEDRVEALASRLEPVLAALRDWRSGGRSSS
jgi:CheY-like chemotaxis protein